MAKTCETLPGLYGYGMQCVLLLVSLGMLFLKFLIAGRTRTLKQFLFDTSKQIVGSGWLHVLNLLFARILAGIKASDSDECAWYWVQIVIDDTIGVWVAFTLLHVLLRIFRKLGHNDWAYDLVRSLHHGSSKASADNDLPTPLLPELDSPVPYTVYPFQVALWLVVVTGMKTTMVLFTFLFANPLQVAAGFVFALSPALKDPTAKLWMVMIVTPLVMNSLQYWLVDNIFLDADDQERVRCEATAHCEHGKRLNLSIQELTQALEAKTAEAVLLRGELAKAAEERRQLQERSASAEERARHLEEESARLLTALEQKREEADAVLQSAMERVQAEKGGMAKKVKELEEQRLQDAKLNGELQARIGELSKAQPAAQRGFFGRILGLRL